MSLGMLISRNLQLVSALSLVIRPIGKSKLVHMSSSKWQFSFVLRGYTGVSKEEELEIFSFLALPALFFSLCAFTDGDFQNISPRNAVGGLHFLWL